VRWLLVFVALSSAGLEPARALGAATSTLVDLSDDWVPRILSDDPTSAEAGRQPYRAEFIRLVTHPADLDERFLELYGIPPSVTFMAARLLDETRHRCHADAPAIPLPAPHSGVRALVLAVQAHLRCEGLLDRSPDGVLDGATATALRLYQREQAIIGNGSLDAETREALATNSQELDFRALLRVLRERVVDATGIIEDGSALGRAGTVFGRRLQCREMRWTDRLPPLDRSLIGGHETQAFRDGIVRLARPHHGTGLVSTGYHPRRGAGAEASRRRVQSQPGSGGSRVSLDPWARPARAPSPPTHLERRGVARLFRCPDAHARPASYRSVLHGDSHGCHRLYSSLAIRLGSFLLAHRRSIRRGPIVAHYRRSVVWRGRRLPLRADTRGYLYELTPPVPVRVMGHDRSAAVDR
jgi:Putative peptidoglycan binding domain